VAAKVKWLDENGRECKPTKGAKGAWWVVVHDQGRRKKRRFGPRKADKARAHSVVREIDKLLATGTYWAAQEPREETPPPLLCREALERWLLTYSATLKPSYQVSAGDVIRLHLAPFFGDQDVRELNEERLLEYVRMKLAEPRPPRKEGGVALPPIKPATIRLHLAILRRVLGLLERDGKIQRNPARGIGELLRRVGRSIASETEEAQHWTRSEVERLIAIARKHEPRFAPLLVLLFSTGVRRGEALGLQWSDVDFDSRVLTVRRSITKEGVGTPKSGKARRVPMTPALADELFDLLATRRREVLANGWKEVPEWLFPAEPGCRKEEGATEATQRTLLGGGRPDASNAERTWLRLRRRAQAQGIRPLKLHCTRHTWATFALKAGKSVRWVADVLGHADPALTLRIYAHAMREEETDLSFADFGVGGRTTKEGGDVVRDGPGRPYTAPGFDEAAVSSLDGVESTAEDESDSDDFEVVAQARVELATPAFSVRCSTN